MFSQIFQCEVGLNGEEHRWGGYTEVSQVDAGMSNGHGEVGQEGDINCRESNMLLYIQH